MYLTLHEDATAHYSIGRDVARMSTSCITAAQLWCTMEDGTQLAAHGIAIPTKESVIDLNLYAPAQGTYLFEIITRAMDAYDVALLYQGGYVASLYDDQPIALDLDKGTTRDYAIRISRKMPTDITNTQSADGQCTKALIDGHMYIFQGGHVYDAQGKTVK